MKYVVNDLTSQQRRLQFLMEPMSLLPLLRFLILDMTYSIYPVRCAVCTQYTVHSAHYTIYSVKCTVKIVLYNM